VPFISLLQVKTGHNDKGGVISANHFFRQFSRDNPAVAPIHYNATQPATRAKHNFFQFSPLPSLISYFLAVSFVQLRKVRNTIRHNELTSSHRAGQDAFNQVYMQQDMIQRRQECGVIAQFCRQPRWQCMQSQRVGCLSRRIGDGHG
jgi:hypothetical protein